MRPQRGMPALVLEEALASWLLPTIGAALLAIAMPLDALGLLADPPAALLAVLGLLVLGASAAIGPLLGETRTPRISTVVLLAAALGWIVVFATPFALRLFPGAPVATARLEPQRIGDRFTLGSGRFDLVLDAHLPAFAGHQNRQLSYAVTLTDDAGVSRRFDGELGDRWQTRRLGRRGAAPVHLEHLSASHEIDDPVGGSVRMDAVTLSGVPNATLSGAFYRHHAPGEPWLLLGGIVLGLGALAFDLWSHPHNRTPTAALVTATATGAVLVFCSLAAGHPGLRQVFGSTIVGGIGGVPTAGVMAWLARRSSWIRARISRRAN